MPILEADLLHKPGVAIVLAEPGAGKTALLASVATRFGTTPVKASIFERTRAPCIVVDAFDEVARIDPTGLHRTLKELRHTGADRTILSSRSGEWSDADTRLLHDIMGMEPIVARLVPFDQAEQALLFSHRHPDANFEDFLSDAARHDLTHLLGNPEFLNLFADAFAQAGGQFTQRHEIFSDAVRYLARETNRSVSTRDAPTTEQRIAWADEVFARLLLSGSDGVAMADFAEGPTFPRLADLGLPDHRLPSILDTRLFRPAAGADRHEPVHRIVAEHCAARALVQRIDDPANTFTVNQCLSLVAPNGTTRDDLRGLLGWMAALGSQNVQDAVIDVDPYAVLSNGDPSRLSVSSRLRLLQALGKLESDDPFFRRVDRWRSFSASGFFSPEIVGAIRPMIVHETGGDLRALLLELLSGSPAVTSLRPELEAIVLDDTATPQCRHAALDCLIKEMLDLALMVDPLIASGTKEALRLASKTITNVGVGRLPREKLRDLLLACANLYPTDPRERERVIGSRYFIRTLVRDFDADLCGWLLDEITRGLACTCGARSWECHCRDGISKIAGHLLDRYFDVAEEPRDPGRIWGWLKPLHFHRSVGAKDSQAVRVLQEEHHLRREIQRLMFEGLTTREAMIDQGIDRYGHAGLSFRRDDIRPMMDHAFATGNVELWDFFVYSHNFYRARAERGPDEPRHYARQQAHQNPDFLARWALRQRRQFRSWREMRDRRDRSQARWRRRERAGAEAAIRSLTNDQSLIEAGLHRWWLAHIANYYLIQPDEMQELTHGLIDVDAALRNYLRVVDDDIPALEHCALGTARTSVVRLHAACVAEFRATRDLSHIDRRILAAVRTDIGGYNGVSEGERIQFEEAVDALLFRDDADADAFITGYVEAQLASSSETADVSWLERKPTFHFLLPTRPLEWLRKFPAIAHHPLDRLFDMAVRHGDRADLLALIRERCAELDSGILPHRLEAQRRFWFLRHFWFLDDDPSAVWSVLDRDPDFIFELEHIRSDQRGEDAIWPDLSAAKITRILDTFIDRWPPVPLPSSWGTGSPKPETAYRYLTDIVYMIGRDTTDAVLPVLDGLLADPRMAPFHRNLRSIRAASRRKISLRDFASPSAAAVRAALDQGRPASVEHMRRVVVEFLGRLQDDVLGGDLGVIDQFYEKGQRLGENAATRRIVNWLRPRLEPLGFVDVIEHQLADGNRCDITASIQTPTGRKMLVVEVKGQWNAELFTAAQMQLVDRYAVHPTAEEQGIYLVLWFGADEKIACLKNHDNLQVADLKKKLEDGLPVELVSKIDIVVLDIERS
ncbi:hypothetical protein PVW51_22795 [Sulfitobacter sp. PR48]|uniref:hypothetical protein n=1 Tax=Sulfitobacter sp. PR48 TaxID=3028383 RepID=UPI00237AC535|nr:hypothetical protein [Sulfitobacter sp. PR48]MDD9723537.1 hypothetical protein [Sulfitobacter sp. PR48]